MKIVAGIALFALISGAQAFAASVVYDIRTDIGPIIRSASSFWFENDTGADVASSDYVTEGGGVRYGLDLSVSPFPRNGIGFGFSYRRLSPNDLRYNGFGGHLSLTEASGNRLLWVRRWAVTGGVARILFPDGAFSTLPAFEYSGGDVGAFFETDLSVAVPLVELTRVGESHSVQLAPLLGVSAGYVVGASEIQFASSSSVFDNDDGWYAGADAFYWSVNLGVSLLGINE